MLFFVIIYHMGDAADNRPSVHQPRVSLVNQAFDFFDYFVTNPWVKIFSHSFIGVTKMSNGLKRYTSYKAKGTVP